MMTPSPLAPAHLRRALLAALVLLALGIEVTPGQAVAASSAAGASEADTITTVLYPGWNMVGWVGPTKSTSELFDAIPALRQVSAWDVGDRVYQHAVRRRYDELPTVKPATALWLRLRGDMTVEWTRPAEPDGVLLQLSEGINLVAVADPEAVDRLDGPGTRILRWEPSRQRYVRYTPGDATPVRGDAVRVEVAGARNWWQAGTRPPPVAFFGDVPTGKKDAILTQYDGTETFFAEYFRRIARGAFYYIANDDAGGRLAYRAVLTRSRRRTSAAAASTGSRSSFSVARSPTHSANGWHSSRRSRTSAHTSTPKRRWAPSPLARRQGPRRGSRSACPRMPSCCTTPR